MNMQRLRDKMNRIRCVLACFFSVHHPSQVSVFQLSIAHSHCKALHSLECLPRPWHYPQKVEGTPLPSSLDNQMCLQTLPDVPWGGKKHPQSKTTILDYKIHGFIHPKPPDTSKHALACLMCSTNNC